MPDNFAELRRLAEAATEGPWEYDARFAQLTTDRRPPMSPLMSIRQGKWIIADLSNSWSTDDEQLNADGEFLAACREGVPALLAELDRLRSEVEERERLAKRYAHAMTELQRAEVAETRILKQAVRETWKGEPGSWTEAKVQATKRRLEAERGENEALYALLRACGVGETEEPE